MRTLLVFSGTTAAALAAVAGVGAASATLHVSPGTVARGATITITGGTCTKGDTVILLSKLFPGQAYGVGDITTKAAADGTFSRTFSIPASKAAGTYSISARCGGGNLGVTTHVKVTTATTRATLSVTPHFVHRGGSVTFTGGPCVGGDTAFLISKLFPGHAYGEGAITAKAQPDGSFSRTYQIPLSAKTGLYSISARCGGGTLGVIARLRIG